MSHTNEAPCLSCIRLMNRYPDFYQPLRDWFQELQFRHPEVHLSCAGRGEMDQQALFNRGATKASFGHSAHNWNAALDLFQLKEGAYNLDLEWFEGVIVPSLNQDLQWYGRTDAPFSERPHVEWANWTELAHEGVLKKVE